MGFVNVLTEKDGTFWMGSGPFCIQLSHWPDSQTWSNLADTLVKRAELLQEAGDAEACIGSVYGQAMAAYAKACSLCSSEDGDDLPGLLHNWGVGLHSLGTHARVIHCFFCADVPDFLFLLLLCSCPVLSPAPVVLAAAFLVNMQGEVTDTHLPGRMPRGEW